jgi:hypothetical protein
LTDAKYSESGKPKPVGRPKQFDWVEKFECQGASTYKDQRETDLSPQKRRPNRHLPSVKVGCKALIWLHKVPGQDEVKIEYHWMHKGHEVGSLEDMRRSMLPVAVRQWLKDLVTQGLDWPQIKAKLRLDQDILSRLGDGSSTLVRVPDTLRVAQKDVYNLIQE